MSISDNEILGHCIYGLKQRPNMPLNLRTHLPFQLPFGLLSVLPTLMQLFWAILTQIKTVAKAKAVRVNSNFMTLVALLNQISV